MHFFVRTSAFVFLLVGVLACDSSSSSSSSSSGGTPPPPPSGPGTLTNDCPPPSGAGTKHEGILDADETWTADASPHHVTTKLYVRATLTIEPCAVVQVGADVEISVEGSLVARGAISGSSIKPVTFEAEPGGAAWGELGIESKGTADLFAAFVRDGGSKGDGALVARGVAGGTNSGDVTKNLHVDTVEVSGSRSYGVGLDGWAAFADGAKDLTITGGGSDTAPSAIRLEAGVAASLPSPLHATGNKRDEILLQSSKTFMRDDTLVARGLPYRAHGPLYVAPAADGAPVTLTIEPGVTLGFDDNAGSGMYIGSSEKRQGLLVAAGTADEPIVFTSAKDTKAAGDWMSLYFHATPSSGNRISHAKIEYAGGASGAKGYGCGPADNDAAILVQGLGATEAGPASPFIDATEFDHIGGTTVIVSGWVDDAGPSLVADNTFGADTPACKVSRPRRTGAGDVCDGGRTTCW